MNTCAACVSKTILLVEDDPLSRATLGAALAKEGYTVLTADDSSAAKSQLKVTGAGRICCVISDYRMPEGTGLQLLAWIKEHDPSLATILITADGDKNVVTESLRGGAIDFLEKPFEIKRLQDAVDRGVLETCRLRRLQESEYAVQEVGRTQQRMLGISGFEHPERVDLCFEPIHHAGGDFFYRFHPGPDRVLCLLTDVSGHDVQAAYTSAYFQGVLRGMLARGASVEHIFPEFNRLLQEEWNQFNALGQKPAAFSASIAACAVAIDFATQTAMIYSQGTPVPVYVTASGKALSLGESGHPLGWFPDGLTPGRSQSIVDGGSIFMWTDGLEALAQREGVSALSLAYALQRAKERREKLPCLSAAVDDVLLAVIHLSAANHLSGLLYPLIHERYHGGQCPEIDELQSAWQRSLQLVVPGLSETRLFDILLASREALLNALEHGCEGDPNQTALFQMAYCSQDRAIRVSVSDSGPGQEFAGLPEGELPERFGLTLITRLANSVSFERKGATVVLNFDLS